MTGPGSMRSAARRASGSARSSAGSWPESAARSWSSPVRRGHWGADHGPGRPAMTNGPPVLPLAAAGETVRYVLIDDEPRYRQAGGGEVAIASFGTRHALSYSSWRRHQWPVSLRPSGARSSHWYMPHTPSSPRSYAEYVWYTTPSSSANALIPGPSRR